MTQFRLPSVNLSERIERVYLKLSMLSLTFMNLSERIES